MMLIINERTVIAVNLMTKVMIQCMLTSVDSEHLTCTKD